MALPARSLSACALGSVFAAAATAVIIRADRVEEHDGSNEPTSL